MTNPTTLAIGTFLKAAGFDRAYPLEGVRSYAANDTWRTQDEAFATAVERGHETAWCINPGYSLTDEPMAIKQAKLDKERANFEAATVVKTGDVFIIEGVAQVCRVHGPRFSDPIVFRPAALTAA